MSKFKRWPMSLDNKRLEVVELKCLRNTTDTPCETEEDNSELNHRIWLANNTMHRMTYPRCLGWSLCPLHNRQSPA